MTWPVRLVFCRGSGMMDALIRAYDHGYWNHVEALMEDGRRLGAQDRFFGSVPSGVQIRPAGYTKFDAEQVVTLPASDAQAAAFWGFLNAQIGKPYDTLGLAENFSESVLEGPLQPLQRDWRQPDAWWCSEVDGAACEPAVSGIFPYRLATPLNLLTPDMLFSCVSVLTDVYLPAPPG